MNRNIVKGLALVSAISASAAASAAGVDTSSVTSGIADVQTAILAVIGALTGLSVAIFGVTKVYGFIKRKAGA
ncbi:major capsid protein [Pseudoduganella sp. S-14]|uniref:major capsid protein n=1 Tax=Pseudoduganella sp. S-14 TaxID=3404065 RepID=UPI003CE83BE8